MLQFRDPNRIPPQEVFNPGSAVSAIIESDDLRRRAALFRQPEKIGIREQCGHAANQLGREIGVKQKFQRKRRSRPACEA